MAGSTFARALTLPAALLGAAPATPAPRLNHPADLREIVAIERAVTGGSDAAALLRHYAPDAVIVSAATGWHEGAGRIRRAIASRLAGVRGVRARIDEVNVVSDGDMACAAMLVRQDATRADGTHERTAVRQLDVFRKADGRWRIVQQHVSVPADLGTGRPIWNGPLVARGPLAPLRAQPAALAQSPAQARSGIRRWLEENIVPTTVDGAMATYGNSDGIVLFDVASRTEHRGLAELRGYFGSALLDIAGFDYRIPRFAAVSNGRLGAQLSYLDLKMRMKSGPTHYMSFRQSDCLRRIGGAWAPVFEMGSFPVDPATGKAIISRPEVFRGR